MNEVWSIVLAAGMSTRMGTQKLLLPFDRKTIVEKVIEAWKNSGKGIVIPLFDVKRGHPTLYDMKYRNEIINLDPHIGLRSVALKFPEDICEVETFCPEIVRDIDTKSDYLNEVGAG